MPIVLTQNETTADPMYEHWEDVEGVQYHYPNGYRNLVREGERFVYYRSSGKGRSGPEYFGCGTVALIEPDQRTLSLPASNRHWYCLIENYVRFDQPVPFKSGEDYLESTDRETPVKARHHSNGVRRLTEGAYDTILEIAGLSPRAPSLGKAGSRLPAADTVSIPTDPLSLADLVTDRRAGETRSSGKQSGRGPRRTFEAKAVGDLAEEIIHRYLEREDWAHDVEWLARRGETPGWDLRYEDAEGVVQRVEVKGTTQPRFSTIELTRNEWQAAERHRGRYHLYLVARCASQQPAFAVLSDPFGAVGSGDHEITPSRWTLTL